MHILCGIWSRGKGFHFPIVMENLRHGQRCKSLALFLHAAVQLLQKLPLLTDESRQKKRSLVSDFFIRSSFLHLIPLVEREGWRICNFPTLNPLQSREISLLPKPLLAKEPSSLFAAKHIVIGYFRFDTWSAKWELLC